MTNIVESQQFKSEIENIVDKLSVKHILIVCGKSWRNLSEYYNLDFLSDKNGIKVTYFMDFFPNPSYECIVRGVKIWKEKKCDCIVAAGGGSAIDVAKCIKLFANMNSNDNYLNQKLTPNNIPLIAIPTTAGSGSEATKFAVIYYKKVKQSITEESCIPNYSLLCPEVLEGLSLYQKKCTMLDALCHAIESFWSINSTKESHSYSKTAIKLIMKYMNYYLENTKEGNKNMLLAANIAGKAINITKTTAAHAMCYKLTTSFKLPHGHAAILCLVEVWDYMIKHIENCIDVRGVSFIKNTFQEIASCMECNSSIQAVDKLRNLILNLQLNLSIQQEEANLQELVSSVNIERLSNNPIQLKSEDLQAIYEQLFLYLQYKGDRGLE